MNRWHSSKTWWCLLLASCLSARPLWACAVCFGAPGDKNTEAAGHAILFMLGVVALILAGIMATVFMIIWRARRNRSTHDDQG